jgi:hypothetical protein
MKRCLISLLLLPMAALGQTPTQTPTQTPAYDPLDDLVSSAKKEVKASEAIADGKSRLQNDPRRKKMESGYWQFFQGRRDAPPGESCIALFWKGKQMISVVGPGGAYKGALLTFIALDAPEGFPRPDDPTAVQKVKVTLTQGADAPATLTALNRSIGTSDEIQFPVPTIEAALAAMEDRMAFKIDHAGKRVFELEWHSALAARDVLRRCVKGEKVDGRELP